MGLDTLERSDRVDGSDRVASSGLLTRRSRPRNLPLAVVALACMAVSVLVFVSLHLAGSDRRAVLALARSVDAGSVLTNDDLTVAEVADDPALSPIPLAARESVVGSTAAVDLVAGSLLTRGALGEPSNLAPGEALVGVEVSAAAGPISQLHVGDHVRLVNVPAQTTSEPARTASTLGEGRVVGVSSDDAMADPVARVAVVVPESAGAAIATASASKQIALVVVS